MNQQLERPVPVQDQPLGMFGDGFMAEGLKDALGGFHVPGGEMAAKFRGPPPEDHPHPLILPGQFLVGSLLAIGDQEST